ncbi:MAG: twin-arginine translocase subunit TatC [Deltaproteobacteria bacterium]|nr:twin-arginine translocase subunit TatC [Deltaproteobacteria bacterium]
MDEKRLTFTGHLAELRRALMVSGIAVMGGFGIAFAFADQLDWALRLPIEGLLPADSDPVYLGIFEPIFYKLKLGLIGGIILASPIVFWQLWWFVSPGLRPRERRLAIPFILVATCFFLGGAAFCYFVVLPKAAAFSLTQMAEKTRIILSLKSYLSNSATFILAFGLVFETPVLTFLIATLGLIRPETLARYRKYVLLFSFVIAAILTPTVDVFNQTIMALPMYVLFELGVLAARLVHWRKEKRTGGASAD